MASRRLFVAGLGIALLAPLVAPFGAGAATRMRRSDRESSPPKPIASPPNQIHGAKGL